MKSLQRIVLCLLIAVPAMLSSGCLFAARQVYKEFNNHRDEQSLAFGDGIEPIDPASLPAGIRIVKDVAYGADLLQRFDVYAPAQAKNAPVILMVHGGGWFRGDKATRNVVENKVKRWLPRGFIVISVNNRLVPAADPVEQARDIARALAKAQSGVAEWGGDKTQFILMGHSAGAHLIALLSASPAMAKDAGVAPWLGSVLLDSGALDVPQIMHARHFGLFDRAFGKDPALWKAASPFDALTQASPPVQAVCSSRRKISCEQARSFVAKAATFGTRAMVLPEDLSHGEINQRLGSDGAYTDAVENFMRSLSSGVAAHLAGTSAQPPGAVKDIQR